MMKLFRPFDVFLALFVCLFAAFFFQNTARNGEIFVISANGERYEFPIETDTAIVINSVEIKISDKTARVTKSSCRNQICVASPALSAQGQIVCVPNRVIVSLCAPLSKKTEIDVYVQ